MTEHILFYLFFPLTQMCNWSSILKSVILCLSFKTESFQRGFKRRGTERLTVCGYHTFTKTTRWTSSIESEQLQLDSNKD